MSHLPPNGPPPYYGYPAPPPGSGGYAYMPVAAPVMMPMPVYHPPPPQPPPHHYPPPPHHYPPPPPEPTPPTYVTNYIYQQPPQPEPVHVVEEPPPSLNLPRPWQAIAGIAETCLSEVNKRIANNSSPQTQTVQTVNHVYTPEVFIDWVPSTTASAASLTHRAFVAGKEGWDGSPLWVIRAHHSGEFVPGKLSVKHRAAYIPHGGREVPVHNFEVLCAPQNGLRWLHASNGQVPVGAIAAGNTHNAEPLYIARVRHQRSTTPGKVHPSHGTAYISFGGSEITYKNYEVLCKVVG